MKGEKHAAWALGVCLFMIAVPLGAAGADLSGPAPEPVIQLEPVATYAPALGFGPSEQIAEAARDDDTTALGQAVVGFQPGMLPKVLAGEMLGGLVVKKVVSAGEFAVVQADRLHDVRVAMQDVPSVAYIEDDPVMRALVVPDDSRYSEQYGPEMMGAHAAWDLAGFGSSEIVVAVLDTGIRRTHQDFDADRILPGWDYANDDSDPADDCDHGTHVSGTVAATTNNGVGVAGLSQATILPMKVLSPFLITCAGSASDIAEAIYDATGQGARIISMSLGGSGSTTQRNAVDHAWNNGVTVVAAAGNDGSSNSVDCPACYESVIAVAALTASKTKASYSDMGPEVEIAAAGSDVLSTVDDDAAYRTMSGTSMATPHVAGALALALGCDPSLSNVQIRSLMQQNAEDLGAAGRDTSYGHGLLRVDWLASAVGCGGGGGDPPANSAPTASFTTATSGLTLDVDGSGSSDPDGDALTYTWDFGDGATGSGATAIHTYAADGTYTVTLTVDDGHGGSGTASQAVTVAADDGSGCGSGDDTLGLQNGESTSISVSSGQWHHRRICVTAATALDAVMDGPSCGLLGCSLDADLYVKHGAKPTSTSYDCRPYKSGSDESCGFTGPDDGWWYVSVYGYSGSGTVTLTATHDGGGGDPPANGAPTASFTHTTSDLTASFDASGSSDSEGDALTYTWAFGDGNTGNGITTTHSYAAAGTYTVTLTVDDGNGGSDGTAQEVTVRAPPPPPADDCNDNGDGVTVMESGTQYSATLSSGEWAYGKICVAAGAGSLGVDMTGPSCGLFSCIVDADLYVKHGAAPTTSDYDCRPYKSGNSESCSFASPAQGWWYVGIRAYSGSGTVYVTATQG